MHIIKTSNSDISVTALSSYVGQLYSMSPKSKEMVLHCSPFNIVIVGSVVKQVNAMQDEVKVDIVTDEKYLDGDEFFLTDGNYILWSDPNSQYVDINSN